MKFVNLVKGSILCQRKSVTQSFLLFTCVTALGSSSLAEKQKIIFPKTTLDAAVVYLDLLKKAIHAAGDKYEVVLGNDEMTESRWLKDLESGSIQIAFTSATIDREKKLLPIRIPLDKGLLGYRLSFTAKSNAAKIAKVKTIDDLKKLTFGQGIGWGDVELYQANGMKVDTAPYSSLFKMTASNRFDIFPRGIGEIQSEYKTWGSKLPDLTIDDHLVIYYPWPYYFFVNKKDTALAENIRQGLEIMIKNGEFNTFFEKNYMASVKAADLSHKTIIKINNPTMSKETPIDRKELWYTP